MKAMLLRCYGGVDQLRLADRPEPEPGAGQLKVRVASAGINPVDWKLRSGALQSSMPLELPAILGRDAAGEVVSVGANVTAFNVGDAVLGLVNGGYAEYVVAPENAWAKIPSGLSIQDAGALPLVLLTGAQLSDAVLGSEVAKGKRVLVTGALGGVGRVALFEAKRRGATVFAGVRQTQLEEALLLGADGTVALDAPSHLENLAQLDAVADTVGGEVITSLLPKIKAGGTVGSVLGEPVGARQRGLTVRAFYAQPDGRRLAQLAAAVAEGLLVIPIAKHFPLAEAGAAQEYAARSGIAKVVLTV